MRNNPGSSIITWLMIGVGGYFVWKWWENQAPVGGQVVSPGLPTGTTNQTSIGIPGGVNTSTGGSTQGTNPIPPVANLSAPLSQAWIAQMNAGATWAFGAGKVPSSASGFQWDYAANHAFGTTGHPTLSQLGLVGASPMTLNDYAQVSLNYILKSTPGGGVSGLGCCDDGMGDLNYGNLLYSKMLNRRGWAVGDFNTPFVGKNQGVLN